MSSSGDAKKLPALRIFEPASPSAALRLAVDTEITNLTSDPLGSGPTGRG